VPVRGQKWGPRPNVSDLTFTIDDHEVPHSQLLQLHDRLFDPETGQFCPDCENPAELCQPVAKVSRGWHSVGARVTPRTNVTGSKDTAVEIMELMVVG
jgi:hypothetical protein